MEAPAPVTGDPLSDDPLWSKGPTSQTVYQQLFDLSPTPTALFDQEGRCYLANRAMLSLLGLQDESIPITDLKLADLLNDPDLAPELLADLRERRVIRRREIMLLDRDGAARPILVSGRSFDLLGKPRLELAFIDVSRLRTIERAFRRDHARLSSLIESLPAGLMLVDGKGIVTEFNPALGALLDLEPGDVKNLPYRRIFQRLLNQALEPEVIRQAIRQAVIAVAEHPIVEIALEGERTRYLEVSFFPVWEASDGPPGWGAQIQDVTQARDRSAWKMELLSILAHDIRTPLATLKGHATALLANYRRWSDDIVLEFLEAMDRGADELVKQVDRSLALTRVEAGRLGLRPEAVSVPNLVHQAVERAASSLGETQITTDWPDALPQLRVDPARVEEVLVNLLDNAAQFNPPWQPIRITARVQDSMIQVSVLDHGPGVPPELRERVFDRLEQGDPADRGSGLGLFISRKIVEAHGGRIWMEGPPAGHGQGAQVMLTLPIMPPQPGLDRRPQRRGRRDLPGGVAQAEILIVEQEPELQMLIHTILTSAGYKAAMAVSGASAVDRITQSEPDLVLLDGHLPDLDGLTVCRNLRRWSNVPILMLTSKTSQEDLIAALDAGADDYLTKPFQSPELLARIRALIRRGLQSEPDLRSGDRTRADGLVIDHAQRQVWRGGEPIELTPTEFDLLAYLARNRNQVLSHEQLISHVWGGLHGSRHTLFVHINRLRSKIELEPDTPHFIVTRWGVGYIFLPS
jgi:PAS domain S-box-containing protein